MATAFSEIAFTPQVRAMQTRMGSRAGYAALDAAPDRRDRLGPAEAAFIAERDSFYQATVSETGWPYLQHRGGPPGFLRVIDERTLGFADFRGNRQYISVGNLQNNDRIALFLMDYAAQRRLKILGRVRLVSEDDDPRAVAALELPPYRAHVEGGFFITVEAFDWNCPQHIAPRLTEAQWRALAARQGQPSPAGPVAWGAGPLALRVTGVRQLARRVRAYELRAATGGTLPPFAAGAHLEVPVRLADGCEVTRAYSIASNPARRDIYEIAVQEDPQGRGGSRAVHTTLTLGSELFCAAPRNDFALHEDDRFALLIAGGIGITPLKAMGQALMARGTAFALHYLGKTPDDMPYHDRLMRCFGPRCHVWTTAARGRPEIAALLAGVPADAVIYVCGPPTLVAAVEAAAAHDGRPAGSVRSERFAPAAHAGDTAFAVTLAASGQRIAVSAQQTLLAALRAAGVAMPASCERGQCGTCVTPYRGGAPDHRDTCLDARRRATHLCPCVSRAHGDGLILDL